MNAMDRLPDAEKVRRVRYCELQLRLETAKNDLAAYARIVAESDADTAGLLLNGLRECVADVDRAHADLNDFRLGVIK